MMTSRLQLPTHLAEYLKHYADEAGVVYFPRTWDIYSLIADLLCKRPSSAESVDQGNVEIALPDRHSTIGKNTLYYNYLPLSAQRIICRKIEQMFWRDVHDIMYEEKDKYNHEYIQTAYQIIEQWHITGISVDAVIKHFYRYRMNLRKTRPEYISARPKICPIY